MKQKTLLAIMLFTALIGCNTANKQAALILISKDYNSNINSWLKKIDPEITTKVFYTIPTDSMEYYLQHADGIVIGGGEDVNPLLYNKHEYDSLCDKPDNYRDSIEFLMINHAMKHNIPLLGICRGNQIMNVANGGTLIPDIPTFYPNSNISHRYKNDSAHYIIPAQGSWINKELTFDTIWVNSHHHQSVDAIAPNFKVAAYAPDSVVESIELRHGSLTFIVGVQWHPESLNDNVSYQIGKLFINKIK